MFALTHYVESTSLRVSYGPSLHANQFVVTVFDNLAFTSLTSAWTRPLLMIATTTNEPDVLGSHHHDQPSLTGIVQHTSRGTMRTFTMPFAKGCKTNFPIASHQTPIPRMIPSATLWYLILLRQWFYFLRSQKAPHAHLDNEESSTTFRHWLWMERIRLQSL